MFPISVVQVGSGIRECARRAGVQGWERVSSHSLRAGVATEAGMRGLALAQISAHLRHKSQRTTEGYVRVEDGVQAGREVAGVLGGSGEV